MTMVETVSRSIEDSTRHEEVVSSSVLFRFLTLGVVISGMLPCVSGFVAGPCPSGSSAFQSHYRAAFATLRHSAAAGTPSSYHRRQLPPITVSLSASTLSSSSPGFSLGITEEDSNTVCSLTSPSGQSITIIGTAHLSTKSNEQVQRLIEDIRPNVVMVELDPTRLHRIGIKSKGEIKVPRVVTSEDIELPFNEKDSKPKSIVGWVTQPFWIAQEIVTEAISRIARVMLTGMYKDMSDKMKNPNGGGGEFLVAIRSAEQIADCTTLVLGDRSSITTIKRAAILAIQSGDPFGVVSRLETANSEEMRKLEANVRAALERENAAGEAIDNSEVQVAMMEAMKEDSQVRSRLFRNLEQKVPEFTQAFLKERDYIMAEAIRRELESDQVQRVVGVVGLGHVPGMEETLKAMFANKTVPLLQQTSSSE